MGLLDGILRTRENGLARHVRDVSRYNDLVLAALRSPYGYDAMIYAEHRRQQNLGDVASRRLASMRPHCAHCLRPVEEPAHWLGSAPIHKGACLTAIITGDRDG